MYRVMLIDDEAAVRNLMKATVNWAELDMEIVGEASSGIEAINTIDDIRPDIAFVDIEMPFMNGIDFTALATQRYPDLSIIILTSYDEFDYARKCIRLPVFDYLLKPIVRKEVTECLLKLKAKLDLKIKLNDEEQIDVPPNAVEQIKHYIQSNYMDSQLNLTSVAQQFGFSSSYLSRKFKQETGKNFVEYLSECRMERAIKMARANVKMFTASAEVGIPDPNYFSRCFKKYTGKSYSEFMSKS